MIPKHICNPTTCCISCNFTSYHMHGAHINVIWSLDAILSKKEINKKSKRSRDKGVTFKERKNRLNDRKADTRQYMHDDPESFVLRIYRKYALADAIVVVAANNAKRPLVLLTPKGRLPSSSPSCALRAVTKPYITNQSVAEEHLAKCKNIVTEFSFQTQYTCNAFGTIPVNKTTLQ